MGVRFLATFGAALLASGQARAAECSVSADAGAVARPVAITNHADGQLLVAMTLMPKLLKVSYADVTGTPPACPLATFRANDADYSLRGDDVHGRHRVALSDRPGLPVAAMMPVVDITKAIEASKAGKAASPEGYMLALVAPDRITGIRLYTGMPDPAVLKADMADALSGRIKPLFVTETATSTTTMFVPK